RKQANSALTRGGSPPGAEHDALLAVPVDDDVGGHSSIRKPLYVKAGRGSTDVLAGNGETPCELGGRKRRPPAVRGRFASVLSVLVGLGPRIACPGPPAQVPAAGLRPRSRRCARWLSAASLADPCPAGSSSRAASAAEGAPDQGAKPSRPSAWFFS